MSSVILDNINGEMDLRDDEPERQPLAEAMGSEKKEKTEPKAAPKSPGKELF